MKTHIILTAVLVSLFGFLHADTLTLYFNHGATDNLFQNAFAESDHLSSLGFSLDKDMGRISLFAEGSYSYLYENPNLTYFTQDLGLDHVWVLGEKSGLYFSLTGRGTFYRSDYNDFNYGAVNAYGAYKSYLSPTSIFKAEYSLTIRDYRLSQFDSYSHALDVKLDKYFQSRTTIQAALSWGHKFYFHPYPAETDLLPADSSTPSISGSDMGQGMGRGKRWGLMWSSPTWTSPASDQGGQGIQTLTLKGLIAQGIGDRIGIRFSGVRQWSISGLNPFSQVWEFYTVENPFYDRYAWDGHEWGVQLTVLAPWDAQLRLGYAFSHKEFPGIEVLDAEGLSTGLMRSDGRRRWEARLAKDFSRFALFLAIHRLDNSSNDPLFDWQGNFVAVGLEWNLFLGAKE
jgi:hypothetical protein